MTFWLHALRSVRIAMTKRPASQVFRCVTLSSSTPMFALSAFPVRRHALEPPSRSTIRPRITRLHSSNRSRVLCDDRIPGEQRDPLNKGLSDENPIERIFM